MTDTNLKTDETNSKNVDRQCEKPDLPIYRILEKLDRVEREAGYYTEPPNWELRRRRRRRIAAVVALVLAAVLVWAIVS